MFPPSNSPPRNPWIIAAACWLAVISTSQAQNFAIQVADTNPLGIGAFGPELPDVDLGLEDGIKGEFTLAMGTEVVANSNFYLEEDDEDTMVSFVLSPAVTYTSDPEGGAAVRLNLSYNPQLNYYFNDSDLNTFDQAGDFTLTLLGGKTRVDLFGRYAPFSGTDQLTGDYIEGAVMTGGARATRQIAARTALNGGFTMSMSDYGAGSDNEGATVYSGYLGGLWDASSRLAIGATLRYTLNESDILDSQSSWGILMESRYRMGERFWLSASLGPEFGEDSDVRLAGDMSLSYTVNEYWTWTNSLRSATVPAPDEGGSQVYDIRFNTSLQRQLLRGSIGFGLDYGFAQYEAVESGTTTRGDQKTLGLFMRYERPLFSDRLAFNSTLRYSTNNGGTDWEQWWMSAGLDVAF